jgi:hypothetical protein
MTDFFQSVVNELSEEEKEILDKIQTKILASLENEKDEKNKKLEEITDPYVDLSEDHPDIIQKKNLTGFPNELIFTVKAEVSQIGEQRQLLSIVDIIEKFYHIPLDINSDYKSHVDNFLNKFHSTLEESCRIIHSNKQNEK